MPLGFDTIKDALASNNTVNNNSDYVDYFKLKSGDSATVRFLEQGNSIAWARCYRLPPKPNQKWGSLVPSLDQDNDGTPCPFRERIGGNPTVRAYLNLIWRDAPKFKRDEKGWMVKDATGSYIIEGVEDRVVVWSIGYRVLQTLASLDKDLKGLSSRDLKIVRQGSGPQDTNYSVYPLGESSPLSDADVQLSEKKYDLGQFINPPSYEDALQMLSLPVDSDQSTAQDSTQPEGINPFMKNK